MLILLQKLNVRREVGKEMIRKKRVVVFLSILIVTAISIYIFSKKTDLESALEQKEIEKAIQQYLVNLAANEWKKAEKYLTGEALLLHQRNTRNLQKTYLAELKEFKVLQLERWRDHAVLVTKAVLVQKPVHYEEYHQRIYLYKEDNWKICSIEKLPEKLPQGINKEQGLKAQEVVEKTLMNITMGEWELALKDLTGTAREEGERTLACGQKPVSTEIEQITIEPVQIDQERGYFLVSYIIKPNKINPQGSRVWMYFRVKNILNHWKVYKTELIRLESGGADEML